MRQLLAENLLLAAAGALLGLALTVVLTPVLFALSPVKAFALEGVVAHASMDGRVLGVTALLGTLVAPLFSLPAAWHIRRIEPMRALQHGTRAEGRSTLGARWREAIVVLAIGLTLALLTVAGSLAQGYVRLKAAPLGFDPRGVLSVKLTLTGAKYDTPEKRAAFLEPVLEQVRKTPGVQQAGTTSTIPLHIEGRSEAFVPQTGPLAGRDDSHLAAFRSVSAGYFETIGAKLVRGRLFTPDDRPSTLHVVVVNQALVDMAWPGEDPIGRRIRRLQRAGDWFVVIGVVADVKEQYIGGLTENRPAWYVSYEQNATRFPVHLLARSSGDPADLRRAIETAVHRSDPSQPVYEVVRVDEHVKNYLAPEQFGPLLLALFSALGLLLAAVGLYGQTAYFVSTRLREIGLRMALGASPGEIRRMLLGRNALLFGAGTVLGLALAAASKRVLASVWPTVGGDWSATAGAVAGLGAIVLLATWIPTRRALRVDPAKVLRME